MGEQLELPPLRCPSCGYPLVVTYRHSEEGTREAETACTRKDCDFGEIINVADALLAISEGRKRSERIKKEK